MKHTLGQFKNLFSNVTSEAPGIGSKLVGTVAGVGSFGGSTLGAMYNAGDWALSKPVQLMAHFPKITALTLAGVGVFGAAHYLSKNDNTPNANTPGMIVSQPQALGVMQPTPQMAVGCC